MFHIKHNLNFISHHLVCIKWKLMVSLSLLLCLPHIQESGEFAEGLSSWPLPLWVSAVPTRCPAESPDPDCPHRSFRPVCPSLPPPSTCLCCDHLGSPHQLSKPAPGHSTVSHTNVPAQPQHSCAQLPPPNISISAHLSQPQPGTTEAVAVASSSPCHRFQGPAVAVPAEDAAGTHGEETSQACLGDTWSLFTLSYPCFLPQKSANTMFQSRHEGHAASIEASHFTACLKNFCCHLKSTWSRFHNSFFSFLIFLNCNCRDHYCCIYYRRGDLQRTSFFLWTAQSYKQTSCSVGLDLGVH